MKHQELADNIKKILLDIYGDNHCFDTHIVDKSLEDIMELVNEEIFQAICDARGD